MTKKEIDEIVLPEDGDELEKAELFSEVDKLTEPASIIVKINNKRYAKWYETTNKDESLDDETTYITDSNQKAFNSKYGGYSIFAISLADMKRKVKNPTYFYQLDRIEQLEFEYAILVKDKELA